jgi:hypothetical protein
MLDFGSISHGVPIVTDLLSFSQHPEIVLLCQEAKKNAAIKRISEDVENEIYNYLVLLEICKKKVEDLHKKELIDIKAKL